MKRRNIFIIPTFISLLELLGSFFSYGTHWLTQVSIHFRVKQIQAVTISNKHCVGDATMTGKCRGRHKTQTSRSLEEQKASLGIGIGPVASEEINVYVCICVLCACVYMCVVYICVHTLYDLPASVLSIMR